MLCCLNGHVSHIFTATASGTPIYLTISRKSLSSCRRKTSFPITWIVNCFLVNGSFKLLVDEILRGLNLEHDGKVNTINALAVFLGKHLFSTNKRIKLTIVLDQAHCLSSFPVSVVKSLLSLPKSMDIICPDLDDPLIRFITHSELPWDRIGMLNLVPQPVSISFECRSEEECIDAIAEALNGEYSRKIVEYVVKAVFFECRDAQRILQIVRLACEKYSEKYGEINEIKNLKLLPVLEALDETDCYWQDENDREGFMDLPLCTKYLLVASFCASHNQSSTDKRYFAKVSALIMITFF
ncbi:hypothetical protein COOONC_10417 [Cooperia oncophora]